MARRTHRSHGTASRPAERIGAVLDAASRYDLALWIVPAAFLFALFASSTLSIGVHTALVGASLVGALAIVDSIALNPPVEAA